MKNNCPFCGQLLLDDGSLAGQVVACPACGHQLQMPPRPSSVQQWYFSRAGSVHGPVGYDELKAMAAVGSLSPSDLICIEGTTNWVVAEMLPALFSFSDHFAGRRASNSANVTTPARRARSLRRGRPAQRWIGGAVACATLSFIVLVVLWSHGDIRLPKYDATPAVSHDPAPPPPTPTAKTQDSSSVVEEAIARAKPSIAYIKGRLSSGTGFLIARGVVVTNAHVLSLEQIEQLTVYFPAADSDDRGPLTAELLYEDVDRDLAFLSVKCALAPLKLGSVSLRLRPGQDVLVIGNPGLGDDLVLENAVSRGVMSTEVTINGQRYYQLGMSVNSGNSGGPALNAAGEVIGVVTAKAKEGLCFCVPLDEVSDGLLRANTAGNAQIANVRGQHRVRVEAAMAAATASQPRQTRQSLIAAAERGVKEAMATEFDRELLVRALAQYEFFVRELNAGRDPRNTIARHWAVGSVTGTLDRKTVYITQKYFPEFVPE